MDDIFGRASGKYCEPFGAQFSRRLETAIGVQIVLEETVHRPRNVPSDRVDGFVLATKTVWATRIDQVDTRRFEEGAHMIGIDTESAWPGDKIRRLYGRHFGNDFPASRHPGGQTAIQDSYPVMPQPTQKPPEPTGDHALRIVIDDDLGARANSDLAQARCQSGLIRQWVTSITPRQRPR